MEVRLEAKKKLTAMCYCQQCRCGYFSYNDVFVTLGNIFTQRSNIGLLLYNTESLHANQCLIRLATNANLFHFFIRNMFVLLLFDFDCKKVKTRKVVLANERRKKILLKTGQSEIGHIFQWTFSLVPRQILVRRSKFLPIYPLKSS